MTKYRECDVAHSDRAENTPCALCNKEVDVRKEHYVKLDGSRRAMHTECAIAEAVEDEAKA